MENSMLTLDELKSRNRDKNGYVSGSELKKIKKCYIFLGVFVAAIVVAAIVFL